MGILDLVVLAVGLSMDAFAVAICKGLAMRKVSWKNAAWVGLWFGGFQALMPLVGFLLANSFYQVIEVFDHWIAFVLLLFIGGKMLIEGLHPKECKIVPTDSPNGATVTEDGRVSCEGQRALGIGALLIQGVATSIDALSVGFSIADYGTVEALVACLMIGVLTLGICTAGVLIGKKFGTRLAEKASVFGGAILILIGLWIFIEGVFL